VDDIIVNILKDLLIISITLLVQFTLPSYVIALAPIKVLQVTSSNQQNILTNLTTTEFVIISNSTITFNAVLRHYIIPVLFDPLVFIFLISDILCYYLKAKRYKRNLNY
jgi:hypothetical protein